MATDPNYIIQPIGGLLGQAGPLVDTSFNWGASGPPDLSGPTEPQPLIDTLSPDQLQQHADAFANDIANNLPPPDQPLVKSLHDDTEAPTTTSAPPAGQPFVLPLESPDQFDVLQPETAGVGALAVAHTATDKALANQKTQNIEVKGSPITQFAQATQDLINSPKYWGADATTLKKAVADLAKEYGDPTLANRVAPQGGWQALVDYRKGPDARPSAVDWSTFGKKTDKTPSDTSHEIGIPLINENSSTARMKAGFREGSYASLEAAEELIGVDAKNADAHRRYYNEIGNLIGPGIQPSEVKNVRDALTFAAQTTVEQSPYLAASMAGGAAGAVIKGSIGAALGAFGASFQMELGQVEENTKDLNPDQKAGFATVVGSTAAAALDSILPAQIGAGLVTKLGQKDAERAAWQMLLAPKSSVIGQTLAAFAKGAALEGSTEAAQEVIEEATGSYEATGKITFQPGLMDRVIASGAAGALLGGPASASEHVAGQTEAQQAPLHEMANAPFVIPVEEQATNALSPSQSIGQTPGTPQTTGDARPLVLPVTQQGTTSRRVLATDNPVSQTGEEQKLYIPSGPITSRFGPRQSFTTLNGQKASSNHAGVDIGLPMGTPVGAAADGVVVWAGKRGGYGNAVVIKFTDGKSVLYGHLSKIDVEMGDQVTQHQTIGNVGQTGNATGPHLHFELRDSRGRAINPENGEIVYTGSTTSRETDAEGNSVKVKQVTDNTGYPVNQEKADYGEDAHVPPEAEDALYTHFTGQELVQPEQANRELDRAQAVQLAKDILSAPRPPIAEQRAAELDDASKTNAASQALQRELSTTSSISQAIDQNPAVSQATTEAFPSTQNTPDFNQPLPGERPFYDEDLTTVVGFMDQNNNVREIGQPPSQPGQLPADLQSPAVSSIPQETQPQEAPQTPVEAQQAPEVSPEPTPAQPPENAPSAAPEANQPLVLPTTPEDTQHSPDVQSVLDAIDNKLFDLENDGNKAQLRAYLKSLVKKGVIEQQALDGFTPMFKDRDMGVEDIAHEVRMEADMWAEKQRTNAVKMRLTETATPREYRGAPSVSYEVAPAPASEAAARWRSLPRPQQQAVSDKVNGFVLPKVLRMLRTSANPVGHIGGYLGESNPSVTLSTVIHTRARDIGAALGHVLDQDSVLIMKEGLTKSQRGNMTSVLRISNVTDPEQTYKALWNASHDFSGYVMNGSDMLVANFSNASTTTLAEIADKATGGAHDISVESAYVELLEKGKDYAGGQEPWTGTERANLDRLRSEAALYRDQLIGRAEQGANERSLRGTAEPTHEPVRELTEPPVHNGKITLDHFSNAAEDITRTEPSRYGTNQAIFSKDERNYANGALPQTHFGIATGQAGGYNNEFKGRTHYQAQVPANRLYDAAKDPDHLWTSSNLSENEQRIKDAGYLGYWVKHPGMGLVAKVFESVPVTKVTPKAKVEPNTPQELIEKQGVANTVRAVLNQFALNGRISVEVVDRILPYDNRQYAEGVSIAGTFDPASNVIRIAAFSGDDPHNVVRHELIHWARQNLFTNTEWAVLAKWARNNKPMMTWAKTMYAGQGLSTDELIEEAVAEGFARWQGGRLDNATGLVGRAFAALRDVINAVREALGIAGITRGQIKEAANVLSRFQSGEIARERLQRQQQTVFGRKPYQTNLSAALQSGQITPDEYIYMRQHPEPKFAQRAWHGSRVAGIEQFKTDFIGTGEGAQVFGWGLYFAESKEVGEFYRDALTGGGRSIPGQSVQVNGQAFDVWLANRDNYLGGRMISIDVAGHIADYLNAARTRSVEIDDSWLEEVRAAFQAEALFNQADAEQAGRQVLADSIGEQLSDALAIFDVLRGQTIDYAKGGLYEVEVPEKSDLLNYDKEINAQPARVKDALAHLYDRLTQADLLDEYEERKNADFHEWTGAELIKQILPRMVNDDAMPTEGMIGWSPELENALQDGDYAKAGSVYLMNLGIRGHIFLDQVSRNWRGAEAIQQTHNFVIYDETAVKVAARYKLIDNSLLSDPTIPNTGLFGRLHTATMALLYKVGLEKTFDPTDRFWDAFRRKFTQHLTPVQRVTFSAAKALGFEKIPEAIDPYLHATADERGYKLNFLTDNYIHPMAEEMASRNVTLEELGLYLYARHAPARNARIARINPTEFNTTNKPGSGMSDAEAAKIMQDFAADGKLTDLQAIAPHIDGMIQWSQQEMLDGGLLNPTQLSGWFRPDEYYVPLKDNEQLQPTVEFDFYQTKGNKGGGFSTPGPASQRAYGRHSKADLEGIVGNVVTQAQIASDRAFRNKVGQKILELLQAVPDPEFAKIDRVKRVPVWNKKLGQVEYQLQSRIVASDELARTIYVKVNGDDTKITFNHLNPSAMRFVEAAKNLDMPRLSVAVRILNAGTRFWSALQTSWNPQFLFTNPSRDVQIALTNALGIPDLDKATTRGLRLSISKNLASLKPLIAAYKGSFHKTGTYLGSSGWAGTYAEYEANGGKINFNQIDDIADALKSIDKEVKRAGQNALNPIRVGRVVLETIDHANSAMENMTRLAAYKALRDRGVSAKVSAKVARELTTNFAQHGQWGPLFNAAYGFANASLVGNARLAYTLAKNPKVIVGLIVAGVLSDLMNHWLDPNDWDQYSEEDKDYHWTVMLQEMGLGWNIHVPIGYGLNPLISLGRKASELVRGKKKPDGTRETMLDAMGDILGSFANSWSPVQGYSFWNIITPSLGDPFVDVAQNRNHWGQRIMPTQPDRLEQQKPDSQLAFERTAQFWKTIAQGMNSLTGGNDVIPGWVDVSPETLKHIVEEEGGGALRTASKTAHLIGAVATGQAGTLKPNDIPFARSFAGRPYGAAGDADEQLSSFYERMRNAQLTIGQAKQLIMLHGKHSDVYQQFRKDNQPIIDFYHHYEKADKKLKTLNAADNAAERLGENVGDPKMARRDRAAVFRATHILVPQHKLTDEQVQKIKDKVKERKVKLATRFNTIYMQDVMGPQ